MERLITKMDTADATHLSDMLYLAMLNAEEALITAGAKPEEDYTYRDLLAAAAPIAAQWFADNENASFKQ